MANETEIKLRIEDLQAFRRALKELGARHVGRGGGRVHEQNVLFDTRDGELGRREQLLRIRTDVAKADDRKRNGKARQRVTVTFKRPVAEQGPGGNAERHKVREEIEAQVSDGEALTKVFEGLGMRAWFRYEKYRTTFRLPESQRWAKDLLIELDETPIGTFVELEGPAKAIDRAAGALGFSKRDYIVTNYLVLYREECRRQGKEPGDMVFAKRKSARGAH